jgi:preprotein translocase subunit SecA
MQYARGSVGLRAYGQQDPLIEYRKEATRLFKEMQAAALARLAAVIPTVERRVVEKEDEALRKEKQAAQVMGGSLENANGRGVQQAVKKNEPGRNEFVTVTNGSETREMKYKKAEALLQEGWEIVK